MKWVAVLCACIFLTGSDFIEVKDIPSAYDENIVFGKVIKEIRLEGNKDTRDEVVFAAMASRVGEIYTKETASLDRKWLAQLGVFTSLFFQTIEEEDGIVLVIKLTEVNKYVPAVLFRVTDENGWSFGGLVSTPNLGGWAAKASVWFLVGGATDLGFRFKDPWIPGRSWWAGYQLDYKHTERFSELYDFDESTDDVFFQLKRNITDKLRWGPQAFYLSFKSDRPGITLSPDDRDQIYGLGAVLQYDGRNMPIYPTQGFWAGLNLKKFGLGGVDTDYWQFNADLRKYLQIGGVEHALVFYSFATLNSGEVGVDIPVYMQFNLGGANSVRGWELGSREGKHQFLNTIEYWYMLMRHKRCKAWFFRWAMGLQLGVFGDIGTAWSTDEQFHQNWIGGGGVGFRILLPASVMFRIDVAAGGSDIGLRLCISGREKAVAQMDRVR